MAVSVSYALRVNVRETLDSGVDGASTPVITHNALDVTGTINATSTPPATKHIQDTSALTAGAATIDLTALTGTGGATVNMTGLKVQIFRFKNNGAATMTIGEGATNGYELLGNAWSIAVPAGGAIQLVLNETAPDVGASAKTIDIAGTGTQAFQISIVAG